jgi:hypothetical protein
MGRKLTEVELTWVNELLKPQFKGKNILYEQIMASVVSRQDGGYTIELTFETKGNHASYPYDVQVPVIMRVHVNTPQAVLDIDFKLQVRNGLVERLLIFSRNHADLSEWMINLGKVSCYEIPAVIV